MNARIASGLLAVAVAVIVTGCASPEKKDFEMYLCRHIAAENLETMLNELVHGNHQDEREPRAKSERDVTITKDQRLEAVIVYASKQELQYVMSLARELDRPQHKVLLESRCVEIAPGAGTRVSLRVPKFAPDVRP